jgi:hypothetical protein
VLLCRNAVTKDLSKVILSIRHFLDEIKRIAR